MIAVLSRALYCNGWEKKNKKFITRWDRRTLPPK